MLKLPPEGQLRALLKLISHAALESRAEAWQGENEAEGELRARFSRIARLMDAIHNIPRHMANYDTWDQRYFELCLGEKESDLGSRIHRVYSAALEEAGSHGAFDDE